MLSKALCVLASSIFMTPSAIAGCGALPDVSRLVVEIERLERLSDRQAILASVWKIKALSQNITKPSMLLKLSELGFQRKLPDVMALKNEAVALTSIAENGITSDVHAHLKTPRFKRRYDVARHLTKDLCLLEAEAQQSDAARKEFGALSALGISPINGIGTPSAAFGLLSLACVSLIGLGYGTKLRQKRLKRERRRNKRYPCDVAVRVAKTAHISQHRLVDISRSGANMENTLELPPGTVLELDFGGLARQARVTWSNTQFAGVEFDKFLSVQDVQNVIRDACELKRSSNKKRDAVSGVAQIS